MNNDLLNALQQPTFYPHPVKEIKKLETHISWIFLTGDYAYKIKKPVNFGFVDYSTLEKRKHFCEQEVKLNKALTSSVYLDIVTLNKADNGYEINGKGEVIDYAIKMKEFSQENLLDRLLERNELTTDIVDNIAKQVAGFHMKAERAPTDSPYGKPETVKAPVTENFAQSRELLNTYHIANATYLLPLENLEQESESMFKLIYPVLEERKKDGYIRNCHGDLHLGNITLIDGEPVIFDCIEFNEFFRWTDPMADVGFLLMDFFDRGQEEFGMRFLNTYMIYTGDYEGLLILPYYFAYRAMVRAKIQLFSINPKDSAAKRDQYFVRFSNYMHLAQKYFERSQPFLLLMHGFSGSGKSTLAVRIAEQTKTIMIRSDVERKRIYQVSPSEKLDDAAYQADINKKTYEKLLYLTEVITTAGYSVIVDATFLKADQRKLFTDFAVKHKIPFSIIFCEATHPVLEERLNKRNKEADFSHADMHVLKKQRESYQPLSQEEQKWVITTTAKKGNLLDVMGALENKGFY